VGRVAVGVRVRVTGWRYLLRAVRVEKHCRVSVRMIIIIKIIWLERVKK
jgi:hypothetical protein